MCLHSLFVLIMAALSVDVVRVTEEVQEEKEGVDVNGTQTDGEAQVEESQGIAKLVDLIASRQEKEEFPIVFLKT